MKRFSLLVLFTVIIASCKKGNHPVEACPAKVCTNEFASVPLNFVNKSDQPQNVNSYYAVNQRTGLEVKSPSQPLNSLTSFVIADDNMLSQFSTAGDDVLITVKALNQTKTAVVNVSGGCNCHIERKSGPQTIKFD